MMEGLKERDFTSNTFGRYVDQEIARELLSRPEAGRLGGEKREVVILFSDLRDFTPLAETLSPEATIQLVNRHFAQMIEVLQQHRGIIVDFLGDAILAFFDPLDGPLAPTVRRAVRCGLRMEAAVVHQNSLDSKFPKLQMGIGLHVGGSSGGQHRFGNPGQVWHRSLAFRLYETRRRLGFGFRGFSALCRNQSGLSLPSHL